MRLCRALRSAHIIDVRCRYFRANAYYHRIYECLLPLFGGMMQQLEELQAQAGQLQERTGQVCMLGEASVLHPYLQALRVAPAALFVDELYREPPRLNFLGGARGVASTRCANRAIPIRQRWLPTAPYPDTGGAWWGNANGLCDPEFHVRCSRFPTASGVLARALYAQLRSAFAFQSLTDESTPRIVVLVTRTSNSLTSAAYPHLANGTRRFAPAALAALRSSLSALAHANLRVYSGEEDVRSTMQLFARARAVVAVHGAGNTNAVFSVLAVCVCEISTFVLWKDGAAGVGEASENRTTYARQRWRSTSDVLPKWSPSIDWTTFYLLADEFIANPFERAWFSSYRINNTRARTALRRDRFLSTISAVGVSSASAQQIAQRIATSWA